MRAQTEMVFRQHGGPRTGSGPKKRNRFDISHHARPFHEARFPVHIMLRVRRDVPGLRQRHLYHAIRAALRTSEPRSDFRVVHLSIQQTHVHFIVEASSTRALSKGMQGLAISAARRINAALGRRGKLFECRYKAVPLTSLTQSRAAVKYVLENWKKHGLGNAYPQYADWYASDVPAAQLESCAPDGYVPLGTSPPRTWLLERARSLLAL